MTIGDMAATRVEGTFTLAYLVYNTINNLTTQDAQVACFRNAAAHLAPGRLLRRRDRRPGAAAAAAGAGHPVTGQRPTGSSFDRYDHVTQQFSSHYIEFAEGRGGTARSRSATSGRPSWT